MNLKSVLSKELNTVEGNVGCKTSTNPALPNIIENLLSLHFRRKDVTSDEDSDLKSSDSLTY